MIWTNDGGESLQWFDSLHSTPLHSTQEVDPWQAFVVTSDPVFCYPPFLTCWGKLLGKPV